MLRVKDDLTYLIIMIDFGQDHEDTIWEASAFDTFAKVVLVSVDTIDEDRQLVIDDHVLDGFRIDAVNVWTDQCHFVSVDLVPVDVV